MLYTEKTTLVSGALYSLKDSDVVFLGLPFDSTETIKPGSRFAPKSIRDALNSLEGYVKTSDIDIFEEFKICDLGDVVCVPGSFTLTSERIIDTIKHIKEKNNDAFLIFIGGEHLITYSIIKSLNIDNLIDLDAHRDLRNDYLGNNFSHVTVMRRILEINENINLTQIGVRSSSKKEEKFAKKKNITHKLNNSGKSYLSIDMDVLDLIYAPGVSNPEPNGLSFEELFGFIDKINKENLIGLDLVEVNPLFDMSNITSLAAAKIILRIISEL